MDDKSVATDQQVPIADEDKKELLEPDMDTVAGGFNPQPDPPGHQ
jgi:hypothetical protein